MADRAYAMSEADLERAVRDLLTVHGLWGYHPFDSRRSAPGWPDWVVLGTRVLFRELKTQSGRLSPDQRRVGYLLQAAGADWAVWRPADLMSGQIGRELEALRVGPA
jgi:hypothetical protein